MHAVHPLVFPAKMSTIRQRFSFNEVRPVSLVKLERGLAQRSLLYCLEKGYFSLIHYLLQSGATNARERDSEGRTALVYCCFIENDSWAQNLAIILLEYGAKIGDEDQRGLNALHYAIITERLILVRRYLESLDFNLNQAIDIHGNTCLHYASSTGNIDIVRLVLNTMKRYSIDLSIKNHYGLTAYDIACQINNEHCQTLLRNEMADCEQNRLPPATPIKTNLLPSIYDKSTDRHWSTSLHAPTITSTRLRATTPATHGTTSASTAPLSMASLKNLHKPSTSLSSFNSDSIVYPSSVFINPTESRNIKLRRNESLDLSLLHQARSLSSLGSSPSTSHNNTFNTSPSTWRNDFSKIFDRLQTLKTPSYRETVHVPLSSEIPTDLYQSIYSANDTFKCGTGNYQPLTFPGTDPSQKGNNKRRSSVISAKIIPKVKK